MSRPHDENRSFLPFGNPFRMIIPKRYYISRKLVELVNSFEQTMAESLKKMKPEDISDIWCFTWLGHAMNFLAETHNNIKILITELEFPVSDWEEKWIDIYLDSSVKLLDICIALSSELSRLDQSQVLLQYVLHVLDLSSNNPPSEQLKQVQTSLSDWMQQFDSRKPKLEDCSAIMRGLAASLYSSKVKNSAKGEVLMRALYGVKVVTIFVCSVFLSVLTSSSKPLTTLAVSDKFLWSGAFNDLQADVLKEITSHLSREELMMLKEWGAVEKCVKRLMILESIGDREEEEGRWKELGEETERLSFGLDHLSKQVENFFQIVLTGRDALLRNLGASDEETMQVSSNADESL